MIEKKLRIPAIYLPIFEKDCPENVLLWGGRGSGRSYTAGYKVLTFCMQAQAGDTFFVGRYFKDDLESTVIKQIKICAMELGIPFIEDSKERVVLPNGCIIRFESFKDETNLRSSPQTIGFWYEECQQADNLEVLMNLRATARRVADRFFTIWTMNRLTPKDSAFDMFERMSPDMKLVVYACVFDNEFAKGSVYQEYLEAKKQLARGDMTEDEFNLVWLGLPSMDGERTFYKYRFLDLARDDGKDSLDYADFVGRVAGVDLSFGGADFCVYTLLDCFVGGKKKIVRTEKWKPISSLDTAARISEWCRADNVKIVATDSGDGGGKDIYERLQQLLPSNLCEVYRFVPGTPLKNGIYAGISAANMRAYEHLRLRNDLELGRVFALPDKYITSMASLWKIDMRDGKFYVESKSDNKKHTGKSPDENDSLVIANAMSHRFMQTIPTYKRVLSERKINDGFLADAPTLGAGESRVGNFVVKRDTKYS